MRARFMRQDEFEFLPTLKLLIIGNHKPVLHSVDDAIGGASISCHSPGSRLVPIITSMRS